MLSLLSVYIYLYFYRSEEFEEEESDHEESDDVMSSEIDEDVPVAALSEYEIKRKKRIDENKRRFEEHFASFKKKTTKVRYICLADFHELPTL